MAMLNTTSVFMLMFYVYYTFGFMFGNSVLGELSNLVNNILLQCIFSIWELC